ncbi:uncharacterized protein [Physcomitrium patens]|uniref:uncharacterized protein isoform X3 n=1 Tax=Physcomitrium patens TaxID=3218 RepID=UPI000D165C21|nr:uncharacterized protein LOC112295688 isoform X2 [Physcomitrium patens]|eukprot:XP_024403319.1 uncharacterized protein LOC112295688 isoform X2 [Physcomitrella patens]
MAPKKKTEAQRTANLAQMQSLKANQMNPSNMEQSEAIQEVWADVWSGFDLHMLNVVCFARLNKMDGWDHPIVGQHPEEWNADEECELPPIDTWARQCIPIETESKTSTSIDDTNSKNSSKSFANPQTSQGVLVSVQDALAQRGNSTQLQLQSKSTIHDSKHINIEHEADSLFIDDTTGWKNKPAEESSESEDEYLDLRW